MRLKRNSAFNLAGGVVPALAALAAVPFILHSLGKDQYGLLVLITSILGYFALLDVNVTAGSTKFIAEFHARGERESIAQTISFGWVMYLFIGAIGGVLIYALAPWLASRVFGIGPEHRVLAVECLQVAAVGFLLGQVQTYLTSIPQALLRYDVTATNEMAFGVAVPLGSVFLLATGWGLLGVVAWRVVVSGVNVLLLVWQVRQLLPGIGWATPRRGLVARLTGFSAYSFLSRAAQLSYAHGDKLIVGAFAGTSALAVYAIAATVGNRVLGMMYRVSAVLMPAASALQATGDLQRLRHVYLQAGRYVLYANLAALLLIGIFAESLLRHWVGEEVARAGTFVLQLVALAQFVDSLTNLPSLVNDGRGFARVSGLFALARALIGLLAVWILVQTLGIAGAAIAHLVSAILMTALFVVYVHSRTVPVSLSDLVSRAWLRPFVTAIAVAAVVWPVARTDLSLPGLLLALAGTAFALAVAGWLFVVTPEDRARVTNRLVRAPGG